MSKKTKYTPSQADKLSAYDCDTLGRVYADDYDVKHQAGRWEIGYWSGDLDSYETAQDLAFDTPSWRRSR